jgi:WXG100 family type VII secretion target
MSDVVKADPADLLISADHLAMHSTDLRAAHAESDADIEATQAGWTGTSAVAMHAKFTEWQEFTDKVCGELDTHQDNFRAAADAYQAADADGAKSIDARVIP